MIEKFISWLNEQVGSIYVWGAQGEINFNENWITHAETSDKNAARAIALYRKRKEEGKEPIAAYDCSGLVVKFFLDNRVIYSDMTSRGLYGICNPITESELVSGDLVFRHDGTQIHHVGVYIGNGEVIHAKGRDYGVVREGLHANSLTYWNKFGRVPNLTERGDEAPAVNEFPKPMHYSGATYINLRSVPSAASGETVIDKVVAGENVLALSKVNDGWVEIVKLNDKRYIRGYCVAKWFTDADKRAAIGTV